MLQLLARNRAQLRQGLLNIASSLHQQACAGEHALAPVGVGDAMGSRAAGVLGGWAVCTKRCMEPKSPDHGPEIIHARRRAGQQRGPPCRHQRRRGRTTPPLPQGWASSARSTHKRTCMARWSMRAQMQLVQSRRMAPWH